MMSDRRSNQEMAVRQRRADRLSPEVKEFLHMLQAIEEHPDACAKDDGESQ
jgi:hypothetical protein